MLTSTPKVLFYRNKKETNKSKINITFSIYNSVNQNKDIIKNILLFLISLAIYSIYLIDEMILDICLHFLFKSVTQF